MWKIVCWQARRTEPSTFQFYEAVRTCTHNVCVERKYIYKKTNYFLPMKFAVFLLNKFLYIALPCFRNGKSQLCSVCNILKTFSSHNEIQLFCSLTSTKQADVRKSQMAVYLAIIVIDCLIKVT